MSYGKNSFDGDIDAEIERWLRNLRSKFKFQGGVFGPLMAIFLAIVVVIGVFGSFFTVQPDQEAVVLRLGKYVGTRGPGLQFKFPYGIDRAYKLRTQQVLQEEFGFRTKRTSGSGSSEYRKAGFLHESLMLTGDLNIAEVEWVVQYQIADPYKFLFATSDPEKNIRDISQAIIRRVVGDRLVNAVFERTGMASESKALIQEKFDQYDMGVRLIAIEFQDVLPPELVRPSFNEVNAARQELEKLINQAEARYNKVIPEARGKAEQTIAQAEGQGQAIINRSRGDAEKFNSMLTEYRKAPQITKERLYLETMEIVFERLQKLTIVDSEIRGLLPVFTKPSPVPGASTARSGQ